MPGVIVFNEFETMIGGQITTGGNLILLVILFLIGFFCSGGLLVAAFKEKSISCLIMAVASFIFFSFSGIKIFLDKPEYETRYEVSVTNETSMNDFFEKYELIEQRGLIYTVRKKAVIEKE